MISASRSAAMSSARSSAMSVRASPRAAPPLRPQHRAASPRTVVGQLHALAAQTPAVGRMHHAIAADGDDPVALRLDSYAATGPAVTADR